MEIAVFLNLNTETLSLHLDTCHYTLRHCHYTWILVITPDNSVTPRTIIPKQLEGVNISVMV